MSSIIADSEFQTLEKKYQPYLDLHGIEEIFSVFDIKQAPPGEAIRGTDLAFKVRPAYRS